MSPRRFLPYGILLVCSLWPRPGRAQPSEGTRPAFGERGQWVVSGSSSVGIWSTWFDDSAAKYLTATLAPTVDRFMMRNVSLGLALNASYSESTGYGADSSLVGTRTTSVRAGPRVGLNVPVGRRASFWPNFAVGFEWTQRNESLISGSSLSIAASPLGYPSTTEFGPWVELDLALLVHVSPHLFLGVVPGVFRDFGHVQGGPDVGGQQTRLSAGFLLGGWFGGRDVPTPAPDADALPERRFGDAGIVAITNELTLSGGWTGNEGSSSSSSSAGATLGADYFVVDRVSLGGQVGLQYSSSTALDPTNGATVTSQNTNLSAAGRIGVDVPVGSAVSFWPRLSLGASEVTQKETESSALSNDSKIVWLGIYAPMLVHPARHLFVGLGPLVYRDLSHPIVVSGTGTATQTVANPSTELGVALQVGGWF